MVMQSAKTVTGQSLCTYLWQFLKVMPFVFEIRQLSMWAIGLPLAGLGLIGMALLWEQTIWPRLCIRWLLLLVPPIAYFLMLGLWHSKFIRYLLPFVPYVTLAAAYPLQTALQSRSRVMKWGVGALTALALCYSGLLGGALSNLYAGPDPRIRASDWMVENIPAGSTVLHDPEPLITLPLGRTEMFQIRTLDLYGNRMQNINNLEFYVHALQDQ